MTQIKEVRRVIRKRECRYERAEKRMTKKRVKTEVMRGTAEKRTTTTLIKEE